jgi:hypothetical protein
MLSAVVTSSAAAEQTAFGCGEGGSGAFSDAHCTNGSLGGPYSHFEIAAPLPVDATNLRTASGTTAAAVSTLKGPIGGAEFEIKCTEVEGLGEMTNAASSVTATGKLEYRECSVAKPVGSSCVVTGEAVTTKELTATTNGQAANTVKVTPSAGTELATIQLENCSMSGFNKSFPINGSLVVTASGATLTSTHLAITMQGTLKIAGNKFGLEGSVTMGVVPLAISLT